MSHMIAYHVLVGEGAGLPIDRYVVIASSIHDAIAIAEKKARKAFGGDVQVTEIKEYPGTVLIENAGK